MSSQPRSPRERVHGDVAVFSSIIAVLVLLGAPAGLIWARVAPRLTLSVGPNGPDAPDLLSSKAFIGADGSFLLVGLVMGLVSGALAWRFARRSGPFTVAALVIGGLLAALVAAEVGLRPGADHALQALSPNSDFRGQLELYLGRKAEKGNALSMRAPWTCVGWPVGACIAFFAAAIRRPEDLD